MGDRITKSIRVNAPLNQVYQAWSRFENFPLFMENIKTVWMIGPRTSIWEAEGPMGSLVQWKAETVEMLENAVAKIFSNPEKQLETDLENFKSLLEKGEIPKAAKK